MKKAFFLCFLFFITINVFSQTDNNYSVVGKWGKTKTKMVDGFKRETHKENEILDIKFDGTYFVKNSVSEINGTWVINGKVLTFTNLKATYSVEIIKLSSSKMTLFSKDEIAKFHNFYIRKK